MLEVLRLANLMPIRLGDHDLVAAPTPGAVAA